MIPTELLRRIRRIEITTSRLASELLAGQYHSAFKGRGIEFGVECKAFRVKVTVSRGEANFVLWALLEDTEGATAPSGNSAATLSAEAEAAKKRFEALKYPYRILDLRENENFID